MWFQLYKILEKAKLGRWQKRSGCQGLGGGKGVDRQSPADFGALKPLCMIRHGGHTSLYICPDPQNGREPVWSMGCGWRWWVSVGLLIVVYEPLQRRMLAWGGWACWGRDAHEFSVPSTQSCCELKAALIKPILKTHRHCGPWNWSVD